MPKNLPTHTSNSGMTLIEVMISIAISSIVILASVSIGQMTFQTQAQNNISFQADVIRRNMVALITSTAAWNNTTGVTANTVTSCLHNGTSCASGGGGSPGYTDQPIYIIEDAAGTNVYDVTPSKGFNNDGSPCSTNCPLTYTITWSAICGGAVPCTNPQVKVVVTPTYHPPSASGAQKLIFNAANYSATIYR